MGSMRPLLILCSALLGFAGFASHAFAQPQLPATFYGSVTVEGAPAANGVEVRGFVNGVDCTQAAPGERTVIRDGEVSAYVLYVVHESQRPGCATANSVVTFTIAGRAAVQSVAWKPGPVHLDLSVGTAPPIPLPSPSGTVAAAIETGTSVVADSATPNPSATLSRPTGTPPTDDVHFDQTQKPPVVSPGANDGGGPSVLAYAVAGLLVLTAAAGAAAFALRRRSPPAPPAA